MLKEKYLKEIVPALQKEIGKDNPLAVPTLDKVVINMGVGRDRDNKEELEKAKADLTLLAGQTPSFRAAKKAIASYGIRRGDIVGISATLRGDKMWGFFEKLVNVVLPRTRDFKGISKKSMDRHGNLTIGVAEHTAFPEIESQKVEKLRGLEITIATTTNEDEKALRLLKALGMPFRN